MSHHNLHGAASKAGGAGSSFSLFDFLAEPFSSALGSSGTTGAGAGAGAGASGQGAYVAAALVVAAAGYVLLPSVSERLDDLFSALSLTSGTATGASSGGRNKRRQVPGLVNYANWCFANATLQALASVHALRLWLVAQVDDDPVASLATAGDAQAGDEEKTAAAASAPAGGGAGGAGELTQALSTLLHRLQIEHGGSGGGGGARVLSSMGVVGALERLQRRAVGRAQQDAQEFLHLLLEAVAAEANGCSLADSLSQMRRRVQTAGGKYRQLPLEGATVTTTVCTGCGNQLSRNEAPFLELTLHPPRKASWWSSSSSSGGAGGKIDLQSMLDAHFGEPEQIDDYACDHCVLAVLRARNNKADGDVREHERRLAEQPEYELPRELRRSAGDPKSTIVRTTRLLHAPTALCLHVNRSVFDAGGGIFASGAAARNAVDVGYGKRLVATIEIDVGGVAGNGGKGTGGGGSGGGSGARGGGGGEAKTEKVTYDLRSIVVHQGHHDRGHYTCYKRVRTIPPPSPRSQSQSQSPAAASPADAGPTTVSDAATGADADADVGAATATTAAGAAGKSATKDEKDGPDDAAPSTSGEKQAAVATEANSEKKQKSKSEKPTTRWYAVSDETVRQVELDRVLSHGSDLFLSFWERRPA